LDEWERLKDPDWKPDAEDAAATHALEQIDITKNKREFTALIRTEIFHFLRSLAAGRYDAAAALVPPWAEAELLQMREAYYQEHERLMLDPEARNHKHTYVTQDEDRGVWTIAQVLVDPEGVNDWQATFTVDKAVAREEGKPLLTLVGIAPILE
jgi:hypothetical protein